MREGEAGLNALIDTRQQENVELDFKAKADASHGSPNDSDQENACEALSGFANSAGGLLIWGIDRHEHDGIDCAQSPAPIARIEQFRSAINGLIGQLVMPRLDGVRTAIIFSTANPGSGYLLLDVERSERRPHRAEAKGKKAYVKRIGDSFFEMEHYDIEDAFKRNRIPDLSIAWDSRLSSRIVAAGLPGAVRSPP